jgi:hypothetical protein
VTAQTNIVPGKGAEVEKDGLNGQGAASEVGASAAARVRTGGPDFESSFLALRGVVRTECAGELDWQARVAVGLRTVLEFAAARPDRARALTVQLHHGADSDREDEVLDYFAFLLAHTIPEEKRVPISSLAGIVDSIATIIRGHLLAGSTSELGAIVPDLVYLILMPYTGLAEARRWASASLRL